MHRNVKLVPHKGCFILEKDIISNNREYDLQVVIQKCKLCDRVEKNITRSLESRAITPR